MSLMSPTPAVQMLVFELLKRLKMTQADLVAF